MVKLPTYIEVANRIEFSRLVCALERVPRTSFSLEHDGKPVIAVQMDLLKERPVIYYATAEKTGHYISYGFKAGKEESDIVNTRSEGTRLNSSHIQKSRMPSSA